MATTDEYTPMPGDIVLFKGEKVRVLTTASDLFFGPDKYHVQKKGSMSSGIAPKAQLTLVERSKSAFFEQLMENLSLGIAAPPRETWPPEFRKESSSGDKD